MTDTSTSDDGVTLPVKSVDPEADVSERVSDNVSDQIGPARYFVEDKLGNEDTCWADVFDRVSRNVAIAEIAHHDMPVDRTPPGGDEPIRVNEETVSKFIGSDEFLNSLPDGVRESYDEQREEFYDAMSELRFIPNSPALFNAGTELQQYFACYVNSPEDSMDDIFDTVKDWGIIQKGGGGVGAAFHKLRPKGTPVRSTGGVSSGPVSFMELFDTVGGTVQQGGRRRSAQMAIMHSHHPDVGRFAVSKRGEDAFTCFNISVGISDRFIEAVRNNDSYILEDPETGILGDDAEPFEVVPETAHFYDPRFEDSWNEDYDKPGVGIDGNVVEDNFWRDHYDTMMNSAAFDEFRDRINLEPGEPMELPARFIWQLIIDGAYHLGEPGVYFIDETAQQESFDFENEDNFKYYPHGTNPCSEMPLSEGQNCNLGHVNLSLMVDDDRMLWDEFESSYTTGPGRKEHETRDLVRGYLDRALDMEEFEETVRTGVRFLDNAIDVSEYPLDSIETRSREMRKIGLGIMGFHQMLLQMGIEYGSDVSVEVMREIARRLDKLATCESNSLAHDRGVFPVWDDSKWSNPMEHSDWFTKHGHREPSRYPRGFPVRNHSMTTVAPTGTTSLIGDTTGGIEPVYQVAYFKNVGDDIQGDEMLVEFDDYFLRVLEANDIDVEAVKDEASGQMMENSFDGIQSLSNVPDDIGEIFVTTSDIDATDHVRIQGACQTYIGSGISKTLNLPNDANLSDVSDAFMLAERLGVKGTTAYRDGSRSEQVLTTRVDNKLDDDATTLDWLLDEVSTETGKAIVDDLDGIEDYVDTESLEQECDECGSGQLDLSEGCPVCMECGASPCKA